MRRIFPLLLAAVLPLVFCRSTRADFIYQFTTTTSAGPGGSLSATIEASDAAVAMGALSSLNINVLLLQLTGTSGPFFYDFTSNSKDDLYTTFEVDKSTGAFTKFTPGITHTEKGVFDETVDVGYGAPPDTLYFVTGGITRFGHGTWTVTNTTAVVPAPSSLLLAALGVLGLVARTARWRRRSNPANQCSASHALASTTDP
jgi:hypothetical protein